MVVSMKSGLEDRNNLILEQGFTVNFRLSQ